MGRHIGTRTRDQRGFTLIELMIVVAVIAILAAIGIPAFLRQSTKVKASSEVTPMMAEFAMKLDQYKVENGAYPATVDTCPALPTSAGTATSTCLALTSWGTTLRINPPQTLLRCSYAVTTGTATATTTAPTGFTWAVPPSAWYFIVAECDSDGGGGSTNAKYFMASNNTAIQKVNEGK